MKKILYGLFTLLVIGLIISNPFVFIGLALTIWGIYKIVNARQSGMKSKTGIVILIIGAVLFFGGFGAGGTVDTADEPETEPQIEETVNEEEKEADEEEKKEARTDTVEQQEVAAQNEKEEPTASTSSHEPSAEEHASELGLELVTVSRVIDGDTIELSDGRKVRLIGVNTPESTTRTEPYGKEASDYTRKKLEGKQVYLQRDVSETDRYGRYLRLVWLDVPGDLDSENEIRAKMFNADLVINGYAEPATYPPDIRYAEYFRKFAREARDQGIGLWAYGEEGTTKGDFDTSSSSSGHYSSGKSSGKSSGNQSSSSSSTSAEKKESFKNCTELRKVYPEGVPEGHPAYHPKHDRDKDGWACEISK